MVSAVVHCKCSNGGATSACHTNVIGVVSSLKLAMLMEPICIIVDTTALATTVVCLRTGFTSACWSWRNTSRA